MIIVQFFFNETKLRNQVSRFWLWDSHCENPVVGVEKQLPYWPQDQRSRTDPYLDIPPRWRFGDILFFLPVGFSFLSCLSFDIFELLQQRALVASAKAINVTVAEVQNGVTRVEGAKAAAGAGATRERNGYRIHSVSQGANEIRRQRSQRELQRVSFSDEIRKYLVNWHNLP
jgi:hypothetical protein